MKLSVHMDSIDGAFMKEISESSFFFVGKIVYETNKDITDGQWEKLKLVHQPRFRSMFILNYEDRRYFIYRARQGGGNREEYDVDNERFWLHPKFLADYDDAEDSTYNQMIFKL